MCERESVCSVRAYVRTCVFVRVCVHLYMSTYERVQYEYMCVGVYVCLCMCVCMYAFMYYVCMCVCTHARTCVRT